MTTSKAQKINSNTTDSKPSAETIVVNNAYWYGVAFFVVVCIALAWLTITVVNSMTAEQSAPVTELTISGEMPYTIEHDIKDAIADVDLGNFFKVNVDEIQQRINRLAWVYSVSVRKQWPNKLDIYVVDQVPVARWNGDFLINQYGETFQVTTNRINHIIPEFYGPEGTEKLAVENFVNLNKLLTFSALTIRELVLSERYSWQLTLNDGVILNLGRENRVERVQRFMDAYPQIKKHQLEQQAIKYIDLRYDTGLAVGWAIKNKKQRV